MSSHSAALGHLQAHADAIILQVDFVPYIVEPAKSDRSKCNKKTKNDPCAHGGKIGKGHLRIGSWNEDVGGYSWYVHLECWRVPAKVWLAFGASPSREQIRASMHLMDSVSICGFTDMSPEQQDVFIEHVINSNIWARIPSNLQKPRKAERFATLEDETEAGLPIMAQAVATGRLDAAVPRGTRILSPQQVRIKNEEFATSPAAALAESALIIQSSTPPKRGGSFTMPIPGLNGAVPGAMVALNVVLTGL